MTEARPATRRWTTWSEAVPLFVGIDPGLKGAAAVYDSDTRRLLSVTALPVAERTLSTKNRRTEKQREAGKPASSKVRRRIDVPQLYQIIFGINALDPVMVVLERVGRRPGESGADTAGFGAGAIVMACYAIGLRIEEVDANVWKKKMRVPADKIEAVARAELMFPLDRMLFRAPSGGRLTIRDGHAEAAMLAVYGAEHL